MTRHLVDLDLVNLDPLLATIDAQNTNNALGVIDLRNQIDKDLASVSDGTRQVIDIAVGSRIAFTLSSKNRTTTGLITACAHRSIELPSDRLDVFSVILACSDQCLWDFHATRTLWHTACSRIWVIRQERHILSIGRLPQSFKAFDLLRGDQIRNFRRIGDRLDHSRAMVVIDALCVFTEANHA